MSFNQIARYFLLSLVIIATPITADNVSKNVLITGGAGFIGSNFLTYMFDTYPNYNFLVLDVLTYAGNVENIPKRIKESDRFEFWKGSVTDEALVDSLMGRAQYVVHFAAESHVTRSIANNKPFILTDVMGTQVMMDSLVKHKNVERFIHISTSEVYGTAETEPMTEKHPLNARSPYAAAKAGADRIVYSYCCTYDVPAVIVRPFNNYGPNQHLEKMIPRFISSLIAGRSITVHGDGSAKRDWIHVLDTCKGLDCILHTDNFDTVKHEVFNLSTNRAVSVLEIAHMVVKHFKFSHEKIIFIGDRPGQVACHIGANDKVQKLLDWQPECSLEDGLPMTISWYKENIDWWKKMEVESTTPIVTKNKRVELH